MRDICPTWVIMMKHIIGVMLCLLVLLIPALANAAGKYLTLEELKQTEGPATVQVIAQTSEPTGKSVGYLTSKTTWRWKIKNEAGEFVPTNLYVDMDQYEKMSLSERSYVLNQKVCALTISIQSTGSVRITKISGAPKSGSKGDAKSFFLAVVGLLIIFGAFILFIEMDAKAGTRSQDVYIQKTRILAVNGVEYVTHKGAFSRAIIGHAVAGSIGAILGAMSAEKVHQDNEFTFLVFYNGGKKGNAKEVETVRQSNKRFKVLLSKLEDSDE